MLNIAIGSRLEIDGRACLLTQAGLQGHAVYGPYQPIETGHYIVQFTLAAADHVEIAEDELCARLDVASQLGRRIHAFENLDWSRLRHGPLRLELPFHIDAPCTVEFRIAVTGRVPLLVSDECPLRTVSEQAMSTLVQDESLQVLRLLRPYTVRGFPKARFGSRNDGGYVCLEDFTGLDRAFSFGIENNAAWDEEIAGRGLTVFQFDHTVDVANSGKNKLVFSKTRIAPRAGESSESIVSLLKVHDLDRSAPNIILKIDIEEDEWPVLDATPATSLARFSQILGEFHYFQHLVDHQWRRRALRVIEKLRRNFKLIHVHANNFAGLCEFRSAVVPQVLELTFANESLYDFDESHEVFPGSLDAPCDPRRPDFQLGQFRF